MKGSRTEKTRPRPSCQKPTHKRKAAVSQDVTEKVHGALAPLSPEVEAKMAPVRALTAKQKDFAARKPPVFANAGNPGHLELPPQSSDPETRGDVFLYRMAAATGTSHLDATSGLVADLQAVVAPASSAPAFSVNRALAHMTDIAPRDGLEGMLAAQMVAVHVTAMAELANAQAEGQPTEVRTARVNRASRLMQLFALQMDALNKNRGKAPSEQRVTVEHVHVHDGGQAVVGNVSAAAKPGGGTGEN